MGWLVGLAMGVAFGLGAWDRRSPEKRARDEAERAAAREARAAEIEAREAERKARWGLRD